VSVDRLNIGLILASTALAVVVPFELFLGSYAVLGPLHYLTQLRWLHHRDYFARPGGRPWLVALVLLSLGFALPAACRWQPGLAWANDAAILAVALAIGLSFQRPRSGLVAGLLAASAFHGQPWALSAFGVYLPTLVHVYVFTGAFMLMGALRSGSGDGLTAAVLLAMVPAVFVLAPADWLGLPGSDARSALAAGGFDALSVGLAEGLHPGATAEHALRAQAFIAFGYSYHYLNWFSKTSVIGWLDGLRRPAAWTMAAVWVSCVALYFWDYGIGVRVVLTLSVVHVFLELPLDALVVRRLIAR
jgi:hypothetical protein